MRVLHVIPGVAPRYGGPSQAIFDMCRALQGQGVGTLIATTDADGAWRVPVELGKHVRYKELPAIFFSRQWSEAFKYSHPLARWLDANVKGFDVVHIHAIFSHSSVAAARACRRRDVPYIVRPLGSLDPWSLSQKRFRKRILWYFGVKQMLRGASAIHYTTDAERQLAEAALDLAGGVVIPLGIDGELLTRATTSAPECFGERFNALGDDPYILVLSRLHPKKGLELFLNAFLDVARETDYKRWRLVVAGEGDAGYVTGLKRLVQTRSGNGHVIFTGWLDGIEKATALRRAKLVALPSYQENFGLSVVEAMACGVPVLVSPYVNVADEIQSAGAGWVAPLERTAMVQTLIEALREESERIWRGKAGWSLVRSRFTWPVVAGELIRLYELIMRDHRNIEFREVHE